MVDHVGATSVCANCAVVGLCLVQKGVNPLYLGVTWPSDSSFGRVVEIGGGLPKLAVWPECLFVFMARYYV
eukprot:COSAG02_NODE_6515_length_3523_cov_26.200643_2_plen_71_part_00